MEKELHYLKINSEAEKYFLQRTGHIRKKRAIWYWITKGRHSVSQKNIKLKAVQRGWQWFTSEEWIDKFIREVRK